MNEGIKSLLAKAHLDVMEDLGDIDSNQVAERFAELIIKECYEHCKGQMLPKGMAEEHGLNYNDGVMDCAIGLIQHFGVEV